MIDQHESFPACDRVGVCDFRHFLLASTKNLSGVAVSGSACKGFALEPVGSPCHPSRVAQPFSFGDKRIQCGEPPDRMTDIQMP